MHDIKCSHCKKAFKIDEAGYAKILKQVRDKDFEQQLRERLEFAEKDKTHAVELATTRAASELEKAAATKDAEIKELKARLDASEVKQKLAVTEALNALEKERDALVNELKQAKHDNQTSSQLAEERLVNERQKTAAMKDVEIQDLKAKINSIELTQKIAMTNAVTAIERDRDNLKNDFTRGYSPE